LKSSNIFFEAHQDEKEAVVEVNKKKIKESLSLVDDLDDQPLSQLANLILLENSTFKVSEIKADEETESLQNVNSEKQTDGCKDESELKEVHEEKKDDSNDDFEDVKDESELKEVDEEKKNEPNDDFEDVIDESNEEVGVLPTNSEVDFLAPTTQQKPAKSLLKSPCSQPITKNHRVKFNVELNQCQEYNVDTPMKRTPLRKRKRWPKSHLFADGSPPAKKLNFPASRGLMLLKMSQAKITKADSTVEIAAETSKTTSCGISNFLQQAQDLKSRVKCFNQSEFEKLSINELAELLHILNPNCIITKTLFTKLSKQ